MSENGKKKPIATGYIRLQGRKIRIWIWVNEWKQNDKHPDWNIVMREGLMEAKGGLWLKQPIATIDTDTEEDQQTPRGTAARQAAEGS